MAKRDDQAKLIADQQATIAELRSLVAAALDRLADERVGSALRVRCKKWAVLAQQRAALRTK